MIYPVAVYGNFFALLFSFFGTDAVEPFGKAAIFFKIGGKAGYLSCQQKCFLIDQTDHRIGGDLLFNSVLVGLVRLVRQVGHQTRHKLPELCQVFRAGVSYRLRLDGLGIPERQLRWRKKAR